MRSRPYFPSPSRGQPAAAICARIWCVRPVSSRHSTSESPLAEHSVRYSVTAVLAPGCGFFVT